MLYRFEAPRKKGTDLFTSLTNKSVPFSFIDAEEFAVYDPLGLCPWFAGVCSQLLP